MNDATPSRARLPWQAVAAATVLALLAAALVLVIGARSGGVDPPVRSADGVLELEPEAGAVGDPLSTEFTNPDGTTATLGDLTGRPMVVNFFASWCTPCITEMPDFESVHQQVGERVRFVGLAVQDRPEDAARIVDSTGITYRWGRDGRGDIAGAAGVIQMPTTMFLDAGGDIVEVRAGVIDADDLLDLIDRHFGVQS